MRTLPLLVYIILPLASFISVFLGRRSGSKKDLAIIHVCLFISIVTSVLMMKSDVFFILRQDILNPYLLFIIPACIFICRMIGWKLGSYYIASVFLQDLTMISISYYLTGMLGMGIYSLPAVAIPYVIAHLEKWDAKELYKMLFIGTFSVLACFLIFERYILILVMIHLIGGGLLIKKRIILEIFSENSEIIS